jgi:LacI family transcriptional regulator/LacI family asc operon transcriptional repressor
MRMNIYDVSEKAGVSIATVSRVLNGNPNVSDKTREKVLAVMEECGYTPNAFARGLGLNTMNTIGVMCADSSDLYQAKAVYYIEQQLRQKEYDCILCCTGDTLERRKTCMELLITKKVDGIVLVGSSFVYEKKADNRYIIEAAAQVPVLILNADLEAPNVYCIVTDDARSMEEAAGHLLDQGTEDILYLYNARSDSGRRKLQGLYRAYERRGLPRDKVQVEYFAGYHEDIPAIATQLGELDRQGKTFHGILCSDDSLAMGALRYAWEKGRSVPGDLSVIGYGDSMLVNCCNPGLTSVDTKEEVMCRHLVHTLMEILEGRQMPKQSIFSGELIVRGTTL